MRNVTNVLGLTKSYEAAMFRPFALEGWPSGLRRWFAKPTTHTPHNPAKHHTYGLNHGVSASRGVGKTAPFVTVWNGSKGAHRRLVDNLKPPKRPFLPFMCGKEPGQ